MEGVESRMTFAALHFARARVIRGGGVIVRSLVMWDQRPGI